MQGQTDQEFSVNLQANGYPVAIHYGTQLQSTITGTFTGEFNSGGLKTVINVGDYWMVADFNLNPTDNADIDNDFDGYTENQGDCDDANSNIYPGATEVEDNIDNDCDGDIDEDFSMFPDNLGLVGSAVNDWGSSGPDTPLIYFGNGQYETLVTFLDGEFKFRDNNDWTNNWGDDGQDYTLDFDGANMIIPQSLGQFLC